MRDRRAEISRVLEEGQERTVTFFETLSPPDLDLPVYVDEVHWTVRRVLAHFITIETSMQWLFRNMLAGGPGAPEDFDLERFNRTQPAKLDGSSLAELIDRFRVVRAETIGIVAGMQESDLERVGRHPFHGTGRLDRFILWADEHARLHERDVHNVLEAAGK
ncbi:MAG: DinB family protein [Desulfobacterales bacterium]